MKQTLLIGATSAIASACARLLFAQGTRFFLVARDEEKLQALAADLGVRGAESFGTFAMNAEDPSKHGEMLNAALQWLGQIDIALIAHGPLPDRRTCEGDANLTLREFATNGTSVIALLTVLAIQLEQQKSGALAVITSVAGDRGRPNNYVYGSAKAAVSVFHEGLRVRLFKVGVSLTDVRPGFVATPMTQGLPLPALLVTQPEQVARRIVAGIDRRVDVLYAPGFGRWVMLIIRHIPGNVFKRLKL